MRSAHFLMSPAIPYMSKLPSWNPLTATSGTFRVLTRCCAVHVSSTRRRARSSSSSAPLVGFFPLHFRQLQGVLQGVVDQQDHVSTQGLPVVCNNEIVLGYGTLRINLRIMPYCSQICYTQSTEMHSHSKARKQAALSHALHCNTAV